MSAKVEVVICTEAGRLEALSKFLIFSIRHHTDEFSEIPIFSYQPRAGSPVSEATKRFFEENQVELVDEVLNRNYVDYPLANKPLACSHRQRRSSADFLLFIDSDTFFLRDPTILVRPPAADALLNPVDFGNIATDIRFSGEEGEYWRQLYALLNVRRRREVRTTFSRELILEYYNSGLVLATNQTQLFEQWLTNFERVMSSGLAPAQGNYFVEQSVLSATIAQLELDVRPLGKTYNFPVAAYSRKWRGRFPYSLANVVHAHYHKAFEEQRMAKRLAGRLQKIDRYGDSLAKLQEFGVYQPTDDLVSSA